jgi:crotonobetaine/carnitine-CoA ligase
MASLLLALPERDDDADTALRSVMCAPVPMDQDAFMARYGLSEVWNAFGMTEISPPIMSDRGGQVAKGIGRRRPGYDVRLVDEHDIPVPVGTVGELIVRHDDPWALNAGYHGRPDATARAWRNGWFHTGDAFMEDEDGVFTYVDRMKDAVRRRGQNISSFEVEREVAAHPRVQEVACVGVPVAPGDEEVRVFVVVNDAGGFDPADLIDFLVPRMAPFMVPRYVEVVDELPKSANMRVKKGELREVPLSAATWDSFVLAHKSNGR